MGFIQTVFFISRLGRLVRWESNKHPRDKNGRFTKVGASTYLYGQSEKATFNMPGQSSNGHQTSVELQPGDRVYGMATGSRLVQHADGTGTYYVAGKYNDKLHMNPTGVQRLMNDSKNKPSLIQAVPGQVVRADSEDEANDALNGVSQSIPHSRSPEGKVNVRVPKGSTVHKTSNKVIVHHQDGSASIYDAYYGTYHDYSDASAVLPHLKSREIQVSHPNAEDGQKIAVKRFVGDTISKLDDGILVRHSRAQDGATFYPLSGESEGERIPAEQVTDFINSHGGIIQSGADAKSAKVDPAAGDPEAKQKTREYNDGTKSTYLLRPGEFAVKLRRSTVVVNPDGTGRSYFPKGGHKEYEDVYSEVPAFQPRTVKLRLPDKTKTVEAEVTRFDDVYTLDDGVLTKHMATDEVKFYRWVERGSADSVPVDDFDAFVKEHGGVKSYKEAQFRKTGEVSVPPLREATEADSSGSKTEELPDTSDRSTERSGDSPSDALRRARAGAIARGQMPQSPEMQDASLPFEDSEVSLRVEPGSNIRKVDNGYIVTYNNSSKPAILFKPDGTHSLTGMTKQEINDIPITSQVDAEGNIVDFREHKVYGGISDPKAPETPNQDDIPEGLIMFVDSEEERENFLKLLKSQGIEELDGFPIEVKIQVRKEKK